MPQTQTQQVQVNVTNQDVKGVYSNQMMAHVSAEEFCLDFLNVFPPVGALTARVVVSPGHLKRMLNVLQESLKKYEDQHGIITAAPDPGKPKIGFNS